VSQFRGVSWHHVSKKWVAQYKVNRRSVYLGLFEDEIDAAKAYDAATFSKGGTHLNFGKPIQALSKYRQITGRHTNKTSKYKGVHWNSSRGEWRVSIAVKHKKEYIGSFTSEEDAAKAYNKRCIELRGDNAIINQGLSDPVDDDDDTWMDGLLELYS
jgi:hypothetical protein